MEEYGTVETSVSAYRETHPGNAQGGLRQCCHGDGDYIGAWCRADKRLSICLETQCPGLVADEINEQCMKRLIKQIDYLPIRAA